MLGRMTIRRERGLSLIEMMIGLAIGLLVIAVAAAMLVGRIREHRALLVEARLMQDLRTSMDIVTRDLRRAGFWGDATAAMRATSTTSAGAANPYTALSPVSDASDTVSFQLSRDASENNVVDDNEQFGFRLRKGVIEMLIGDGGWQALTDAGTMFVVSFEVVPSLQQTSLSDACIKPCDVSSAVCGPVQQVRNLAVAITARASADSKVVRSLTSQVRLRNDVILGACPA